MRERRTFPATLSSGPHHKGVIVYVVLDILVIEMLIGLSPEQPKRLLPCFTTSLFYDFTISILIL
jgi:hypothetical protein